MSSCGDQVLTRIFIDFLRFSIKIKEGEGATRASQSRNLSRQYYLVASKGDDVTQDVDFDKRKMGLQMVQHFWRSFVT